MEIEKYRTIETTLDLANDYTPPIRLNTGDIDGRILKFNITDGGNDVDKLNGLKARLTWNRDPTDPAIGGGYTSMTKTSGTDNPTGVHRVSFTTPVPRALLLQAGERTVAGIDIEDADGNIIASRNIPVLIDTARLNPKAGELADPLKDLHDTIDQAQELIDTASIDLGTVTTLNPNKKVTGTLTGSGWKRRLNLSIPRGSTISSMTATALDTGTPTVTTGTDANGDITIALGLPRGKQGEKGDKGDPGDAGGIATMDRAGIVKPGTGLTISADGTLSTTDVSGQLHILWMNGFVGAVMFCGYISRNALNIMAEGKATAALELGMVQIRESTTVQTDATMSLRVEGNVPALPANNGHMVAIRYTPVNAADYRNSIDVDAARQAVAAGATEIIWTATGAKTLPAGTYFLHASG